LSLFLFFIEVKRKSDQKEKSLFSLRGSARVNSRGGAVCLMRYRIKQISGFQGETLI
jgi:hypothetical protein